MKNSLAPPSQQSQMESTIPCPTSQAMFHTDIRPKRPRRNQWQRNDERWLPSKAQTTGADEWCESQPRHPSSSGDDINETTLCSSRRAQINGRQRQRTIAFASAMAAALMLCSSSALLPAATASFVNPPNFSPNNLQKDSMSILSRKMPTRRTNFATSFPPSKTSRTNDTWSNAVRQKSGLSESRFGVRRRVKSVLDKAKKRTGIDNSSVQGRDETFTQTGPNIVAETASIGGLGTASVDEDERVDAALDFISKDDQSTVEEVISRESFSGGTQIEAKQNGAADTSSSSTEYAPTSAPKEDNKTPDDKFVLTPNSAPESSDTPAINIKSEERNSVIQNAASASSLPLEPLPFTLPTLTPDQRKRAMRGERVQFQDDMGRAGSGFVVWDVKAPASVVWDCLLDFKSYPETIPTVREVVMYTNTHLKEDYRAEKPLDFEDGTAAICKHGIPSVTRAQFSLSKFRLKIAAVHTYRPHAKGDYMIFTLDPASTNMVLKYAKGIWHTQSNPDGKEGYTRVWLLCELSVSRLLPQWIVDYAAARAMPRATTWLKPQVEAAATLWLKDSARD
ncbi:hypothetical protein HJC23_012440 [Cyclotella cryptica]|uniref:START domain-containing protein n=1 Tax=Cyclotella cryptica TaxID=29204 RepID=A0ABD3Q2D3_9STRA|eukprot:CCRYP_009374-RA/>CCRYP_009374-RA protein AED:0.17 eAED:0.17 QI:251/1/1/1/0/0/2/1357/564